MVHLYLIGVFCIIFHVIIFFASVVGLTGLYKNIITGIPLWDIIFTTIIIIIGFYWIIQTLKVTHINLRKLSPDLLDNDMREEDEKKFTFLPKSTPIFISILLLGYVYLILKNTYHVTLLGVDVRNIQYEFEDVEKIKSFFLIGTSIFSSYYFIQIWRIHSLINKYGLSKNKKG